MDSLRLIDPVQRPIVYVGDGREAPCTRAGLHVTCCNTVRRDQHIRDSAAFQLLGGRAPEVKTSRQAGGLGRGDEQLPPPRYFAFQAQPNLRLILQGIQYNRVHHLLAPSKWTA